MTASPPRVLVVDDEPMLLTVLEMYLEHLGVEVTLASNGAEALDRLSDSAPFSMVLCDVRMPEVSGPEALAAAKERFETVPPWVFLTGYADRTDRTLRDAGAHTVLGKPTSCATIKAVLADLGVLPAEP